MGAMNQVALLFRCEEGSPGFSFTAEASFDTANASTWTESQRKLAQVTAEVTGMICEMLGGGMAAIREAAQYQDGDDDNSAKERVAAVVKVLEAQGKIVAKSSENREAMNRALGGFLDAPVSA